MVFGYARVSTQEQSVARQVQKFRELGITQDCIFIDKASGKDFAREQYQLMKLKLRAGRDKENDALQDGGEEEMSRI